MLPYAVPAACSHVYKWPLDKQFFSKYSDLNVQFSAGTVADRLLAHVSLFYAAVTVPQLRSLFITNRYLFGLWVWRLASPQLGTISREDLLVALQRSRGLSIAKEQERTEVASVITTSQ